MESTKPLKPWQPGYVPEDFTNKRLVAHFRYMCQTGVDNWSELSEFKQFSGTTTLKEIWDWRRDCHYSTPISLTISPLS